MAVVTLAIASAVVPIDCASTIEEDARVANLLVRALKDDCNACEASFKATLGDSRDGSDDGEHGAVGCTDP